MTTNKFSLILIAVFLLWRPCFSHDTRELKIEKAVKLSFQTFKGEQYRLYSSMNAVNWNPISGVIEGNHREYSFFTETEPNAEFFKLELVGFSSFPEFPDFSDYLEGYRSALSLVDQQHVWGGDIDLGGHYVRGASDIPVAWSGSVAAMVYHDYAPTEGREGMFLLLVDSQGKQIKPAIRLTAAASVFDSGAKRIQLLWDGEHFLVVMPGGGSLVMMKYAADGIHLGTIDLRIPLYDNNDYISCIPLEEGFRLIHGEHRGNSVEVYALSFNGSIVGDGTTIQFTGSLDRCVVTDFGYATLSTQDHWREWKWTRYLELFDQEGKRIGSPVLMPDHALTPHQSLHWNGTNLVIITAREWSDGGVAILSYAFDRNAEQVGDASIIGEIPHNARSGNFTTELIWTGERYLVVWDQGTAVNPNNENIYARVLNIDGTVDSKAILINPEPLAQVNHGAIQTDDGFIVFSVEKGNHNPSVGFTKIRADELLPPDPEIDMVPISAGTFTMGSPEGEEDRERWEGPQTEVTISHDFWIGKYEVTQWQYLALTGENPSRRSIGPDLPVVDVSWQEAMAYCEKLTELERQAGRLPDGYSYRLPSEAEWQYACRAGTTTRFSYGDDPDYSRLDDYTWHAENSDGTTHPVGEKLPNPWGLYDMHGNVWEWCMDWFGLYLGGSATDPTGPTKGAGHIHCGGCYLFPSSFCRSASRWPGGDSGSSQIGFRVVLAPVKELEIEMAPISPGTFTIGSPEDEQDRNSDEGPQTEVTISHEFWIGKYEVTQGLYEAVTGSNPSRFVNAGFDLPVEGVSWAEAVAFCEILTEQERQAGELPAGYVYRLPTEAEWEYACRAGTSTRFNWGDDPDYSLLEEYAWYRNKVHRETQLVSQKLPNPWGLYDMHGNVYEWCHDWYSSSYPGGAITDPIGASVGVYRVIRGGSWHSSARECRAADRYGRLPDSQVSNVGFRIVLAPALP
jgi:formylglycine-generating enzyme required for sulfatase activity